MPGYVLSWKHEPPGIIDAGVLRPDVLGELPLEQLRQQPILAGRVRYPLAELFNITGESGETLTVPGSERFFHLGQGMKAGTLIVDGPAGDLAGMEMTGGTLMIAGPAGASLGASMLGGRILVRGDTGPETGGPSPNWTEGMTGGEIFVAGRAGPHCGLRMRAGLIATHAVEDFAGYHMLAGTILVRQGPLHHAGVSLRRGTLITLDPQAAASWLPYYQPDCVYEPVFLKVLLGYLQRKGFDIPAGARHGRYQLYSGDRLVLGKGEILQYVG
jgi:formylmethanofuran dehydrogenase subunit C